MRKSMVIDLEDKLMKIAARHGEESARIMRGKI